MTAIDGDASSGARERARLVTLDGLRLPACDFLKIDVEGFEAAVIRGARSTIGTFRPVIYLGNDRASHQGELIATMDQLGYAQYWHVAPLFRPENFNRRSEDIFQGVAGLNMLCIAKDRPIGVGGLPPIDPANWTSPLRPLP